jgi:hypothetical protein
MADCAGGELLARDGEADPGALSKSRRARWRQQTKSVVANELQALTGRGIQDCHDLVGFALAPPATTEAVLRAMEAGRSDWTRASRWWKRCRRMSVEDAAAVAARLFQFPPPDAGADGPEGADSADDAEGADTAESAEPSDPVADDRQSGQPAGSVAGSSMAEFARALDREATRVEGRDAVAARKRRAEAVRARTAWVVFEEEGVGCFSVTGRTSTVAAAMDRIDAIARRARATGDGRTLQQLRSDAALALLTHGTVTSSEKCHQSGDARTETAAAADEELDPAVGGGWEPAHLDRLSAVLDGHVPATVDVIVPLDVLTGADPDGVGEIVGHGFVTGEHARELALVPGSVMHRLVTDSVTGAALDRSVNRYTPDARMRDLVTAVDRMCRGPGCTRPARTCELDHVVEYPDGPTAVTNLSAADKRHHGMKTNRWWSAVMERTSRRIRWTSFFGRLYVTSPHDYQQYSGAGGAVAGQLDADVRDRLVYAALAHRETDGYLADYDDDAPEGQESAGRSAIFRDRWAPIQLRHRTPGGGIRRGPPPGQPTPAELLEHIADRGVADEPDVAAPRAGVLPGPGRDARRLRDGLAQEDPPPPPDESPPF